MSQWDNFLTAVKTGIASAAATQLGGFVTQAQTDAQSFITAIEADLKVWATQLTNNQITPQDFTEYLQADTELAQLQALTLAGIAAEDLQRFRDTLISTIINAAIGSFRV